MRRLKNRNLRGELESGDVDDDAGGGRQQRVSVTRQETRAVRSLVSQEHVVKLTEVDRHLLQRLHRHRLIQLHSNQHNLQFNYNQTPEIPRMCPTTAVFAICWVQRECLSALQLENYCRYLQQFWTSW